MLLLLVSLLGPGTAWAREVAPFADPVPLSSPDTVASGDPAVGASRSLLRIHCPTGYAATVYAEGLSAPDGLAISPTGVLHVAEESAGRVSRIAPEGSAASVLTGLTNPEGIAFDDIGNLYMVEDQPGGRLLKGAPEGGITVLASNLDAPEGVVWRGDSDQLFLTESNAQFASFPWDPLRSHVTVVAPQSGSTTRIVTDSLSSYAGIAIGPEGMVYVTNELSGLITNVSVLRIDPDTGARSPFASDLIAPEGLRFSNDGFPLYVAEEGTGGGAGRLSRVEADGSHAPFCTGFHTIEDVVLDEEGRLYVSEDGSGSIIVIGPEARWRIWLPLMGG
jgi:sugar lactone lactonase YvrE